MGHSSQPSISKNISDNKFWYAEFKFSPYQVMTADVTVKTDGVQVLLHAHGKNEDGHKVICSASIPEKTTHEFFVPFEDVESVYGTLDVRLTQTRLEIMALTDPKMVEMEADATQKLGQTLLGESATVELPIPQYAGNAVEFSDATLYDPDDPIIYLEPTLTSTFRAIANNILPKPIGKTYTGAGIENEINLHWDFGETTPSRLSELGTDRIQTLLLNAPPEISSEVWALVDTETDSLETFGRVSWAISQTILNKYVYTGTEEDHDPYIEATHGLDTQPDTYSYHASDGTATFGHSQPGFSLDPTRYSATIDLDSYYYDVVVPRGDHDKTGRCGVCYEWKSVPTPDGWGQPPDGDGELFERIE